MNPRQRDSTNRRPLAFANTPRTTYLLLLLSSSSSPGPSVAMRLQALSIAAAVLAWSPSSSNAAPITIKGNKFFNSATGQEFRLKGMAYYPRPNAGEFANVGNYDWAADDYEAVWGPHLDIMQELGVNTIRLYSVDPSRSHDKFMCACAERGIYVLVGMTAP
jgi:hypothetical protein